MRGMLAEVAKAFKSGGLNARTPWRKTYRWATLVTFWLVSLGSLTSGVWIATLGASPLLATAMVISAVVSGITFAIHSTTFIFIFSTTEIREDIADMRAGRSGRNGKGRGW